MLTQRSLVADFRDWLMKNGYRAALEEGDAQHNLAVFEHNGVTVQICSDFEQYNFSLSFRTLSPFSNNWFAPEDVHNLVTGGRVDRFKLAEAIQFFETSYKRIEEYFAVSSLDEIVRTLNLKRIERDDRQWPRARYKGND
jgi:hypothetical protein